MKQQLPEINWYPSLTAWRLSNQEHRCSTRRLHARHDSAQLRKPTARLAGFRCLCDEPAERVWWRSFWLRCAVGDPRRVTYIRATPLGDSHKTWRVCMSTMSTIIITDNAVDRRSSSGSKHIFCEKTVFVWAEGFLPLRVVLLSFFEKLGLHFLSGKDRNIFMKKWR